MMLTNRILSPLILFAVTFFGVDDWVPPNPLPATTETGEPSASPKKPGKDEGRMQARPATDEIARLIKQLGSPKFKEREAATKSLAALEDAAWEALRVAAADSSDAEIRRRAQLLIQTIEFRLAHGMQVFHGHKNRVESVAFSPDGRLALSAGAYDGTIRIWEIQTSKELRCFGVSSGQDYVSSAAFSPDGRQVLTAHWDQLVRLWHVQTGREIRRFRGHTNYVYCACFSPNGRQALSGSLDYTVRLWDAATGKEVRCLKGHDAQVWRVAFSQDGKRALSGGADNTVRLWNLDTGEELRRVKTCSSVHGVAFLPDGRHIVAAHRHVSVWDLDTGKEVRQFLGHTGIIYSLALSADGRRVFSGSDDKTVRLWDVATGKELHRYDKNTGGIRSVALSPNGTLGLSGSEDTTLRLWKLPK